MKTLSIFFILLVLTLQFSNANAEIADGSYTCSYKQSPNSIMKDEKSILKISTNPDKTRDIQIDNALEFKIASNCEVLSAGDSSNPSSYIGYCFDEDTISIVGQYPSQKYQTQESLYIYNYNYKITATWKVKVGQTEDAYEMSCE